MIKSRMGRAGRVYGGKERRTQVMVGKHEAKRPLGRSRHRWEDNIKMHLQKVGWGHELD
jgi:hypothetical protein